VRPTPRDWARIERKLGTALPKDYKQFSSRRGWDYIGKFLSIGNVEFAEEGHLGALRNAVAEGLKKPFRLFPEPGGALPWGWTDNADVLWWLTIGPPDKWPTLIKNGRGGVYERRKMGMAELLVNLLTEKIRSRAFSRDDIVLPARGPTARRLLRRETPDALAAAFAHSDREAQRIAEQRLARLGRSGRRILRGLLAHPRKPVQVRALKVLSVQTKHGDDPRPFLPFLTSASVTIRNRAVAAVRRCGRSSPEVLAALRTIRRIDGDARLREEVRRTIEALRR
jgi:hypothetical protein